MSEKTTAEPVQTAQASRDEEQIDDQNQPGEGEEELVETHELEAPPKEEEENLDPRETIARNYEKRREQEMNGSPDEQVLNTSSENDETGVDNPPDTDTINTEPEMVEIKVLGRTILAEKEKVDKAGGVAAYQKEVAVMQGFKDNAAQKKALDDRENNLDLREKQLAEREAQLPKLDAKQPKQEPETDLPNSGDQQEEVLELIKDKNQALVDGEDDRAAEIELEIIKKTKGSEPADTQTVDTDDLADKAANKLEERNRNRQILTDREQFLAEHPELKTDTRLFDMVDAETVQVENDNPDWTPKQILDEAYKRVEEWRGPKPTGNKTELDKKADEKRTMVRPKASTGRAEAPPKPRQQTNSDYIQSLKQSRGQA